MHPVFFQVWVPALSDREDMEGVVQKAFHFGNQDLRDTGHDLSQMAGPMLDFAWWFNNSVSLKDTFGGSAKSCVMV